MWVVGGPHITEEIFQLLEKVTQRVDGEHQGKVYQAVWGGSLLWRESISLCSHTFREETCSALVSKSMYYILPFFPQAAGGNLCALAIIPFSKYSILCCC